MKHLITEVKQNPGHYLALFLILAFGGFAFLYFKHFPQAQIVSAFLTASFYVFWGIIHHSFEGDLHLRVILEYLGIALLGFLILFTIANRV